MDPFTLFGLIFSIFMVPKILRGNSHITESQKRNSIDDESRDTERERRTPRVHLEPGQQTRGHSDRTNKETLEDYGLNPKGRI
ncbi:MAG: hypothetical protein V2A65_02915 [Candidatus Omnitrophota bacterium]